MLGEHGGCSCLKGSGRRASAYEGILSGAHSEAAMSASRADLEGRLPSGLPFAEMALGSAAVKWLCIFNNKPDAGTPKILTTNSILNKQMVNLLKHIQL